MANRKRKYQITIFVTKEEKELIRRRIYLSKTQNMSAYIRKMAIDGYIVNLDMSPVKEALTELHKIGININQIAKKSNTLGDLYPKDLQFLKNKIKELWELMYDLYNQLLYQQK